MRPKLEIVVDVILQQLRQEWLAIKCFVQITQRLLFQHLTTYSWIATLNGGQLEKPLLEVRLLTNCRSICTKQLGRASQLHLDRVILRRTLHEKAGRAPRSVKV